MRRLQSVQDAVTRLIFHLWRFDHVIDDLICQHWLRAVSERIHINMAVLIIVCLVLQGTGPFVIGIVPITHFQLILVGTVFDLLTQNAWLTCAPGLPPSVTGNFPLLMLLSATVFHRTSLPLPRFQFSAPASKLFRLVIFISGCCLLTAFIFLVTLLSSVFAVT